MLFSYREKRSVRCHYSNFIASLIVYLVLFVHVARAQFNQDWTWQPTPFGPAPHWQREIGPGLFPQPVVITPRLVVLEYNCLWMPAICNNADLWRNGPAGAWWRARPAAWANYFTLDVGSGILNPPTGHLSNSDRRRERMCPPNWKGTYANPRCPEPAGQPNVVPLLWDLNGQPVTRLKWPTPLTPGAPPNLNLMIDDGRDQQFVGALQPSGRKYSCDEFPPAVFIEGGDGATHQTAGTTYCAPIAAECDDPLDPADSRGSEQNWQGLLHSMLIGALDRIIQDEANVLPNTNQAIAFLFRTDRTNNPAHDWAGKIYYNDNNAVINVQGVGPHLRRRSLQEETFGRNGSTLSSEEFHTANLTDYGFASIDLVPDMVRGGSHIRTPDGRKFRFNGSDAIHVAVRSALASDMVPSDPLLAETLLSPSMAENMTDAGRMLPRATNGTELQQSNDTKADLNVSLTIHGMETQQQPEQGVIDILDIGTQYILGQLGYSNQTFNDTIDNSTAWNRSSSHGVSALTTSRKQQAVEGPVQCGPGQKCLDGSCCNSDGKCGFKEYNCGDTCISNCEAKAMCGIDSADGKTPCGLKLCCSYYGWCGTEAVHCIDPEPNIGKTPCQVGYGGCEIIPSPTCGKGSGTTNGRRIGYYQGWNTRERQCDKVSPRQINTRGLTHLFYAFAYFDPTTFEITPMNDGDVPLYGEFTGLKRNGLQTWIAIGGWSFNEPNISTSHAYSDMVSSQSNRATFISSLIAFMDKYGFQGADIDWEYPAEPKRGGKKADTDNLVLLMREMHAAFNGRYGSSLTIAPDYWYLRGFKPAAMQDYVDFMGFMSYDLHGPWDEDVKTLGSIVRPQTDITEIDRNLKPLWFDGVKPSKVNFGIAYYGRTYKLTDPSCDKMGCRFLGEGAAGSCTNFPGVLSNREIRRIINEEGISPYLNTTAMVKYFKYKGDSWVGYDDAETYALKEAFANDRCLGGVMIWSIDFDDETGGGIGLDDPNNYTSPESATVIPMSHTTVPPGQTFTLGPGASTDIPQLPNGGDQNTPKGPGSDKCDQCSFFRLITSTCCGTGGSVGNPILIPAGIPTPMDIPLPAGFIPNQSFTDPDGKVIPANQPLPQDTTIPQGTVFTQPFLIGPGTPLHQGEGDDQNSTTPNLIWLSPDIWNEPNPQVQCFFPCTFVLPPWPSFTTTVDYPRITVTRSGTVETTLTFPPLTVSQWEPSTIVVSAKPSCTVSTCSEEDDHKRTSSVQIRTTRTWPWVTYTTSGTVTSTRPPTSTDDPNNPHQSSTPDDPNDPNNHNHNQNPDDPPCFFNCPPPPPPGINPPHITIGPGSPKPTTTPCAYPAHACPPAPGPSPGPGSQVPPDPSGFLESDTDKYCVPRTNAETAKPTQQPNSSKESTSSQEPTPTSSPEPSPTPTLRGPDWSADKLTCYNKGKKSNRARMVNAADDYCSSAKGLVINKSHNPGMISYPFTGGMHILVLIEAKEDCEWKIDEASCRGQMRRMIDECDTNGENKKQGGYITGDCLNWRLDPNSGE